MSGGEGKEEDPREDSLEPKGSLSGYEDVMETISEETKSEEAVGGEALVAKQTGEAVPETVALKSKKE